MSSLIVTLPSSLPTPATPCHTVWTDDAHTVKQHSETPLTLLPPAVGAEIVVMVPACKLSWHRLELPLGTLARGVFQEGNAARLRAVLDGLLEERILDEPAQLHFAIEPQARAGAPIWVAACERAWLNAWLLALEQLGRHVARIVPEVEPPADEAADTGLLQVVGTAEDAQLFWRGPHGVTVLPLTGSSIALLANAHPDTEQPAVLAEPGVAALAEQHFRGRVTLQTAAQRAVAASQSSWDLAQFDLLRTRNARARKRLSDLGTSLLRAPRWKPARWALVALLLVNLAGLQAWAWREQSALKAKRLAIRGILTTTFPDVRVVVDAPLQMARALADLQRQSGTASSIDMESMLGLFQTVAPEIATPTAIEFAAGELRLKGLDPSAPGIDGVSSKLQAHGYVASIDGDSLLLKQERRP